MTFYSPLASPRATIEKLTEWGLSTNKSLGQHFLVDDGVVGKILRVAEVAPGDNVLEVGPGIGTLTEALLIAGAKVTAIEKDKNLLPVLANLNTRYPETFSLIHADALDIVRVPTTHWDRVPVCCSAAPGVVSGQGEDSDAEISSETESSPCPSPTKLIANLPYAVAATIVLDYFEHIPSLQSATIMVQKEVADRMAAQPGTKDYGAYTVKLALFAQPTASFGVARTNFLPPPRVDSTVIRLDRHSSQPTAELAKATYTVIEAAFAQRRKTIRNSMRSHFSAQQRDPEQIDALLEAVNIAPTLRGETLSVADYLRLGEAFATQP